MDNAEIWGAFRLSWKNENPYRNRKPTPEQERHTVRTSRRTEGRLISDLRVFLNFCVSREWLSDNWATKKHKMSVSVGIDPKEPFSDEELDYIYRAADHITDGRGFRIKRTATANARETLIFVWVLVYTGLRISDVTLLERAQLVPFKSSRYTDAIYCNPKKTQHSRQMNFVHIPIPNGQFPGDPDVIAALKSTTMKHGRYFFLGGGPLPPVGTEEWNARIRTATNGWRERINKLFRIAENLMAQDGKQFSHHPHPHRFRHTFCATLLQGGASLRIVAQYIGDTEDVVRKHYAKFCVAEQVEAAKALEEVMLRSAEKRRAERKAKLMVRT